MKKFILTLLCVFGSFFSSTFCQITTQKTTKQKHEELSKNKSRIDPTEIQKLIEKDILFKESSSTDVIKIEDLLDEAKSHIGKRYVWATRGPKTFDCSGYVYYVFKQFGHILSPSSRNQYTLGKSVSIEETQPGDLVFFHSRRHPKGVGHVGIVYGVEEDEILFIHASLKGVKISSLNESYYKKNLVGFRRVL